MKAEAYLILEDAARKVYLEGQVLGVYWILIAAQMYLLYGPAYRNGDQGSSAERHFWSKQEG